MEKCVGGVGATVGKSTRDSSECPGLTTSAGPVYLVGLVCGAEGEKSGKKWIGNMLTGFVTERDQDTNRPRPFDPEISRHDIRFEIMLACQTLN